MYKHHEANYLRNTKSGIQAVVHLGHEALVEVIKTSILASFCCYAPERWINCLPINVLTV